MASYEQALAIWGAKRLAKRHNAPVSRVLVDTVEVKMVFDEGNPCCNGADPDCYCSMQESPSANVVIRAQMQRGKEGPIHLYSHQIPAEDFDFASILREIVEAGDGMVSL